MIQGLPKPRHFNIPQIRVMLVKAQKNYHVWSRGTGKSSGAIAPHTADNAKMMPRSQGGIVGATFQQILVRTLPPVVSTWEQMGYKRDIHFVIGHEPSKAFKQMWNWKGPFVKPLDSKYAIYWFNGSCQLMISQDRIGSANGLSLSYIVGDEAKLLNKDRLDDEVMPTLRGDRSHFGHLPCYRGEFFTTDMPTLPKQTWILDKEKEMDRDQIQLIMQIQLRVNLLRRDLLRASPDEAKRIKRKIADFERELRPLRMGSVYYSEANVNDNIDVLGEDYIKDMRKALSESKFNTSIMNIRPTKIEGGFYPHLDPDRHGTDWFNYSELDRYIGRKDLSEVQKLKWKQDGGFIKSQPLDIALDYGSSINCLVVGQEVVDEYRLLNSFWVLHPQLTADVVRQFCEYYEGYPEKVVNYYYDHTAIAGIGTTSYTYNTIVEETLRKHGWHVNSIYCGQAPKHDSKYEFIGAIMREEDDRLPRFRYSRTHCEQLETSMSRAGIKQGRRGFEKDKSPERDENVAPEDATHLSDALDTLLFFKFHERTQDSGMFMPMSTR